MEPISKEELLLSEIIDSKALESMIEDFHKLTFIPVAILDITGKVLVAVGWQDICTRFHRLHPIASKNCHESDTVLSDGLSPGEFRGYKCKNNMWDMVTPIVMGGQHLGNIFLGQFFYDDVEIDYVGFRKQAQKYGFDEKEYIEALDRVPRISKKTIDVAMSFYIKLSEMISSLSFSALSLKRALEQQEKSLNQFIRSEEKFRSYIDFSPYGIFVSDKQAKYLEVNRAACELTGYSKEELLNMSIKDITPPESQEVGMNHFKMVLDKGFASGETPFLHKDGTNRSWMVDSVRLKDDRIILFVDDITERKLSEKALIESEERFRALFEKGPIGVAYHKMIYDDSGRAIDYRFLDANSSFRELTGVDPRGRLVTEAFPGIENDPYDWIGTYGHVARTGELIRFEQYLQANDRWYDCVGYQFKPDHFVAAFMEITKRKNAEKEREAMQFQLAQAQKIESVGRLAGGVAHDFNNMLGVILGFTEMTMAQVDSDSPIYANLSEIFNAAERSAELTKQLLTFARKQTVTPKLLNINQTLEGMHQMLERLIGEDVALLWNPGKEECLVKIDPSQLDQMLANLCINARDAISDVGRIVIETGVVSFHEEDCQKNSELKPGDFILLSVTDNGRGMDKDTLDQVFEPFFTTKGLGKGTGLGLATVYGVVKQNGGFINVYSELERGTTFKIYLPRDMGDMDRSKQLEPMGKEIMGSERILLVEDEPAILKLTTHILKDLGYTVISTNSPLKAIDLAARNEGPLHLLITDVVMPEMNGNDLSKILMEKYPHLKRLFMSGYTANVISHHGVLNEGIPFIQKPFSRKDLALKIKCALK